MEKNKKPRYMDQSSIKKLLIHGSIFQSKDFEMGNQNIEFLHTVCKVLVIGAGGLGCEILKNLCTLEFRQIDLIDMDTIELTNLNRQFLFREEDIGKSKAQVASNYFRSHKPYCQINPYFNKIQDFDSSFYKKYHVIVCGLDSIVARRWINNMLLSLLEYDSDGNVNPQTIIPLVDGGTEGLKGNLRVIIPGMTACLDCTLDLYPPQINFPLCTIANRPRLPEHCIEYVRLIEWPKVKPFGEVEIDGDNPDHLSWIYDQSIVRAKEYNIQGVTLQLTQGVIKRLIPAVATTNAVIAAMCAIETFKIATNCFPLVNNYLFNDTDGVYGYAYTTEKRKDCLACGHKELYLTFKPTDKLNDIIQHLKEDQTFQLKSPSLYTHIDGKPKTLYVSDVKDLECKTRSNLQISLQDLKIEDNAVLEVMDVTSPRPLLFRLKFCYELKNGDHLFLNTN